MGGKNGMLIPISAVVTGIGLFSSGIYYHETTYAKIADVKGVSVDVLELRQEVVEGRLFDLKRIEEQRSLSDLEKQRKQELETNLERINRRLKKGNSQ